MVNQGIVLGHVISNKDIEIDKAKVELISKLPSPTTIEKELLPVVYALDKFRAYLVGSFIVIFIDHSTLKFLSTK